MVPINKAPLKYVLYLVSVRWDVQHIDQGGHLFTVAKRRGTDIYWLFLHKITGVRLSLFYPDI